MIKKREVKESSTLHVKLSQNTHNPNVEVLPIA